MPATSVRVLFSLPCAASGIGNACAGIVAGARQSGYRTSLHTPRMDVRVARDVDDRTILPAVFSPIGYARFQKWIDPVLNWRFLRALGPGDVAHIWPAAPLDLYDRLLARGVTTIGESVNTLMESARIVLDAEYDAIGLAPGHGITDARIRNQIERYSRCTAIFSPSAGTDAALAGTEFCGRGLPSSYGTWVPKTRPVRPARDRDAPLRLLFGGSPNIRKGIHKVLAIWPSLPRNIELRLLGPVKLVEVGRKFFGRHGVEVGRMGHPRPPRPRRFAVRARSGLGHSSTVARRLRSSRPHSANNGLMCV